MRAAIPVLSAALLAVTTMAAADTATSVSFQSVHPLATRCEVTALRFQLADGSTRAQRFDPPVVVTPDKATKELQLPASTLRVSAVAHGCWIETRQFDAATREVVLRAWPLATLSAAHERIKPEPPSVRVTFVDTAAGENDVLQELTCEREQSAVQCGFPAGRTTHVRVDWGGYVPVYAKNVSVAEERVADLGASELVRAYKVTGRVVSRDGSAIAGARVRLLPVTAGELPKAERVLRTAAASSDARGNYRISGVPPGSYRLISEAAGRADAVIDPLRVHDRDVQAAQLVHTPRGRLEVVVSPPVAPEAAQWKLELSRRGTRQWEAFVVATATVPTNGSWISEPLENAEYTVKILNRAGSEVVRRQITIDGADELLLLSITGISVAGRLLSADDGVAGELTFHHSSGQQIRATAASDGSFSVLFPMAGTWRVQVMVPPSRIRLELADVTIEETERETLEIRLPAGRIEGVLVDAKGQPATGAVTVMRERHQAANGLTADDGRFAIEHLDPGEYTIEATGHAGFAAPVAIAVSDDEPVKVRLSLRPTPRLSGIVTGPSGRPLSGAVVRVFEPDTTRFNDAIADVEGRFTMTMRTTGMIDAIILAPPTPVIARRFAPSQWLEQEIAIAVPPTSASLRLLLRMTPPWPVLTSADGAARSLRLYLMPNFGSTAGLHEFIDGAVQFTIEPGAYTVCLADRCESIVLHPGATATVNFVSLPEKP